MVTGDSLDVLVARVPYLRWLGVTFSIGESGGPLGYLPYGRHLIGNPILPALHGGVTGAFLETTAIVALAWSGGGGGDAVGPLPRTINMTIDYLRRGKPEDTYAQASITRVGRRYASVLVSAYQSDPDRPIANAMGHFMMPPTQKARQ